MRNAKRMVCMILAVATLLSVTLLTGCSAPRLTIGGTPKTAATVADTTYTSGDYLAYLYNTFYNIYYSQGLYQYGSYGYDVWTQKFPYGEGDNAEQLELADFIKRTTKDTMIRQVALKQLMAKYNAKWDEEEEKKINESLDGLEKDAYLSLGFTNEAFAKAYKETSLNERSLFFTLYGEGGERAVSEADRKAYFDNNYLSYKIISMPLTDSEGTEMTEAEQKKVTDQLNGYLADYNKSGNFEKVMDAYNATQATDGEEPTASTDEGNRVNVDANDASDAKLIEAVRGVDVGKAKVVTYKANDTTLTAALILRLDIHDPQTLFTDENENILYALKQEEFNKEVDEAVSGLTVDFNDRIVKKCDPKDFVAE